jgi:hypothetical protein
MISTRFHIDTSPMDRLLGGLDEKVQKVSEEIAQDIVNDIKDEMRKHQSPAPRGSAPAIVSGDLIRSVKVVRRFGENNVFTKGKHFKGASIQAGGGAPHAKHLEDTTVLDRPFIIPAVKRAEKRALIKWDGLLRVR